MGRFERAVALFKAKGEIQPLQVETARFMQRRTDKTYEDGIKLLKSGRLGHRLSPQEALGNFIDREVRRDLREQFAEFGINPAGSGVIRVNRRENDTSGSELSYRRPDARVGSVALDVTLTKKTIRTPQVRGFFRTDFRPDVVMIIRPRQLGPQHTYAISRPEISR